MPRDQQIIDHDEQEEIRLLFQTRIWEEYIESLADPLGVSDTPCPLITMNRPVQQPKLRKSLPIKGAGTAGR